MSSIASSTEEKELCLGVRAEVRGSGGREGGGMLREAHSLDLSRLQSAPARTTCRSLTHFNLPLSYLPALPRPRTATVTTTTIPTLSGNHVNNINFLNGNAGIGMEANECAEIAEACPLLRKASLLGPDTLAADIKQRPELNSVSFPGKKWRSLETMADAEVVRKIPRASFRSWFIGLFNGSGLRTSDGSLRKAVPLLDRESAV